MDPSAAPPEPQARRRLRRPFAATAIGAMQVLGPFACPAAPAAMLAVATAASVAAQDVLPAIADSPTAQALYDDAVAQAAANPAESARLVRRLLDEYAGKVVRPTADPDAVLVSAADAAERLLATSPETLARFRSLEGASAERMLAEEGPRATAGKRRWTRAGLAATLELAEVALREDRPAACRALLARIAGHPDLADAFLVVAAGLEATAAARLGDAVVRDAAIARIEAAAGADPALAEAAIRVARATPARAASTASRSPLDPSGDGDRPDATWREIWSADLERTLFRRLHEGPFAASSDRAVERARADASWMTTLPVYRDGRIYLNDGESVRAIDVDSRNELWSRTLGIGGFGRADGSSSGSAAELSALALDDGALVTFEGHASVTGRVGNSRVWCLDPADGRVLWAVNLDGVAGPDGTGRTEGGERSDEFDGLFPVGRPLLFPDVVVVAARKPTQRLEQIDWLLGLDRSTGRLRWATSIAGASGMRLAGGRRLAGIAAALDAVFISTPLGVVARVRPEDGVIEWLRRVPVPMRETVTPAEPWEMGGPVVAGGRVIALDPAESEIVALDAATGAPLEVRPIGPGTQWETPRYLVAATLDDGTPLVLGIGTSIVAFDARDLSKRRWSLADSLGEAGVVRSGAGNRAGIRGRVSIAGGQALVPGVDDLLVLDLDSGALRARLTEQRPANALLLADRIVAAGDDALRVLMPTGRAEEILRARLRASPDDPAAAMALLELADASGQPQLAIESARAARRSFDRGFGTPSLREQFVARLIRLSTQGIELGDEALAIALAVADTSELAVRVRLAAAEHLRTSGRTSEAIAAWLDLAASDRSGTMVEVDGEIERSVRHEALRSVVRLTSRDVEIANAVETRAAAELEALRAGGATADDLARFASERPRTAAALDAALAAAGQSDAGRATEVLVAAMRDALLPPARIDLVESLLSALPGIAADAGPDPALGRAIEARVSALAVASGLERPALRARPTRYPMLGEVPGEAVLLPRARLPRFAPPALDQRDPALLLALAEGSLVRLADRDLSLLWRLRLDDRDPQVLWANERVVVWQSVVGVGEQATVVDPRSGSIVYSTPRLDEVWTGGMAGGTGLPDDALAPDGSAFFPSQVLPVCDGRSLVAVRRNGDLARYGVGDAIPNPRVRRGVLSKIYSVALADGLLALGGRREVEGAQVPVVILLDAETLDERASFATHSGSDVRWVLPTALGEVIVGTSDGVESWAIGADGRPALAMRTTGSGCADTDAPTPLGASVLVVDRSERACLVPLFDGAPRLIDFPAEEDFRNRAMRGVYRCEGDAIVHATDRVMQVAPDGEVRGVDAGARERNYVMTLPVEGGILVIDGLGGRQLEERPGAFRVEFPYVVQPLSRKHGLRLEGAGIEVVTDGQRMDRAMAGDGWLLLSGSMGLIGIPLPESGVSSGADPGTARDGVDSGR